MWYSVRSMEQSFSKAFIEKFVLKFNSLQFLLSITESFLKLKAYILPNDGNFDVNAIIEYFYWKITILPVVYNLPTILLGTIIKFQLIRI